MTGLQQKKWPMWAVWIGLGPICAVAVLIFVMIFSQLASSQISGSAWFVFGISLFTVIPLTIFAAAKNLNAHWQDALSRAEAAVHSILLFVGFLEGVLLVGAAIAIALAAVDTGLSDPFFLVFVAAFWTGWMGYLAIFIGRLRRRKLTEEVFT